MKQKNIFDYKLNLPKIEIWKDLEIKGLNATDRYDDKKAKRVPIPQGLQKEVIIRSKGKCEKCKITLKGLKPDLHHKNQDPSVTSII